MKGVKRNAQRQRKRPGEHLPQPNRIQHKAGVFEYNQKAQIQYQRCHQPQSTGTGFSAGGNSPSDQPVDDRCQLDDRQKPWFSPAIEHQICREQKIIAPPARQTIISHQNNRQEEKQKDQPGEAQFRTAFTDSANPAPPFLQRRYPP